MVYHYMNTFPYDTHHTEADRQGGSGILKEVGFNPLKLIEYEIKREID